MLQINYIRQNRDLVLQKLAVKNFGEPQVIDTLISLDEQKRKIQTEQEEKLARRNTASKEIGMLMGKGMKEDAEQKKAEVSLLKSAIDGLEQQLTAVEKEILDQCPL